MIALMPGHRYSYCVLGFVFVFMFKGLKSYLEMLLFFSFVFFFLLILFNVFPHNFLDFYYILLLQLFVSYRAIKYN